MKYEAKLKQRFGHALMKAYPPAVMQYFSTSGSPDRSITAHGTTTHWEFKHGTPDYKLQHTQWLTCMQLERQGHCRYVIWQEKSNGFMPMTYIVKPSEIRNSDSLWVPSVVEWQCANYDMDLLVEQVLIAHGIHRAEMNFKTNR